MSKYSAGHPIKLFSGFIHILFFACIKWETGELTDKVQVFFFSSIIHLLYLLRSKFLPLVRNFLLVHIKINSEMSHHIVEKIVTLHFNDCTKLFLTVRPGFFDIFEGHVVCSITWLFKLQFFVKSNDGIFDFVFSLIVGSGYMLPETFTEDFFVIEGIADEVLNLFL